jgi:hypothetical protein
MSIINDSIIPPKQLENQLIGHQNPPLVASSDYLTTYGQALPQPLVIEPVEGGFILSGYFAGSRRRCVVNGIPNLLKTLRSWWGQVKPTKPKADA